MSPLLHNVQEHITHRMYQILNFKLGGVHQHHGDFMCEVLFHRGNVEDCHISSFHDVRTPVNSRLLKPLLKYHQRLHKTI